MGFDPPGGDPGGCVALAWPVARGNGGLLVVANARHDLALLRPEVLTKDVLDPADRIIDLRVGLRVQLLVGELPGVGSESQELQSGPNSRPS